MPLPLATAHLDLIAATLDHVCAELETPERLASLLQAQVEAGWPPGEYDRGAQEYFRDRLQAGGQAVVGWYGWYALRRKDSNQLPILVGAGGYFGPPSPTGEVEIGFSILPAWQNLGSATEIAEALIKKAWTDPRVQTIIAHTAPENLASCRVLEKCGFVFSGTDEVSGHVRFEIHREPKLDKPLDR